MNSRSNSQIDNLSDNKNKAFWKMLRCLGQSRTHQRYWRGSYQKVSHQWLY